MEKIVGLKEFRNNLSVFEKIIQKEGEGFVVVRRSKPLFRVTPIENEKEWEEVVDFTKVKKGGVAIDELLARL